MNKNINSLINNYIKTPSNYKYQENFLNNNNEKKIFKKAIGLYDPYGENINPLTGREYENIYKDTTIVYKSGDAVGYEVPRTYKNLAYLWTNMKVYEFLNPILESIKKNQVTMIKASTGVGKTVITPKIALQAFNFKKKVICTVPKQILAADNAKFSAQCLDVALGKEVGYFYMGKNETSDNTKLTFTTPGSLKSKITGNDPYLSEYSCVIIDEIHERSVQTDQLLLLMKEILEKRPEFRLILMSATIDLAEFKEYFTKKSKFSYNEIDIQAKSYDVELFYEKEPLKDWKIEAVNKIIHILKTTDSGDILVFIKAGGEGKIICDNLSAKTRNMNGINPFCVILEAKSPADQRNYAINEFKYKSHPNMDPNNPYNRKIVMATNVAESSLTVDGVVYVIDNGYSMESSFFPKENARSLIEERISKAAATQRKGRAGRTRSGFCYRLYTEKEYEKFPDFPKPDIQKTDITNDILDIFLLEYVKNTGDVRKFLNNLLSPPSDDFIMSALNKLYTLGAINGLDDKGEITELGRAIAKFRGIEPNFAKSILASYYYHCRDEVIDIILISLQIDARIDGLFEKYYPRNKRMSEQDIKRERSTYESNQRKFHSPNGDYFTMLNVYNALKNYMNSGNKNNKKKIGNANLNGNTNGELNSNNNAKPKLNPKLWCKANGISSRAFVNKMYPKRGKWDLIGEKSRKIKNDLMKIVRPAILKKKYYNIYKEHVGLDTLEKINEDIKREKTQIVDKGEDVLSIETEEEIVIENDLDKLQSGGYRSKPYEVNLFPNAVNMGNDEKNILMSLAVGNICNMAKLTNSKTGIYKTCFPINKVYAKFDPNTTLSAKNRTNIVIYNELFTMYKDQKILKLNLVTKMPNEIILKLSKEERESIKTCFEKEKENIKRINIVNKQKVQKQQKQKKQKYDQKKKKGKYYKK